MFNNSTLFIGLDLGYALTESVIINNMGEMIKKHLNTSNMDPVHLHLAEMLKLIPVIPTLKGFLKSFVRENDGIYPSDHVVPLKYLKKNRRISASDCINRHLIPVPFHFDNIHHLTMC